MTDFVSNLLKKFKKPSPQQDSTIIIKPNSKNLVSSDSVLLNEQVKVNIYSLKEVNIEKDGVVTGNIHSKSCIVTGRVNGNILSSEYIEVKNTAVIEGNIKSGSIQIEAGSMINGFVSIEKKIKLPAIENVPSETVSVKSGGAESNGEAYVTVKNSPPKTEEPVIKDEPVKIVPHVQKEVINLVKAGEEASKTSTVSPDPAPETTKSAEAVKEVQKPASNNPKPNNAPTSNDSWW